jgi:hypothetical protein
MMDAVIAFSSRSQLHLKFNLRRIIQGREVCSPAVAACLDLGHKSRLVPQPPPEEF